jgi:hypothetical protein
MTVRRSRSVALLIAVPLAAASDCGGGQGERKTPPPPASSSCYASAGVGVHPPAPERAVFVLVDQTTGLDDRLRERLVANLRRLLGPGTTYTIASFSAFSRGNYVTTVAEGALEPPLPPESRPGLSVRRVERLEACLREQAREQTEIALARVSDVTSASASSFSNSEIMASLAQLSEAVRASRARDKLVIVVSDLLEFSSATSFYRNRAMRSIDPDVELARAVENRLLGDFGQARVAVIGAGLLSPESGLDATRDVRALNALHSFWERWFERSHAQLAQYGQPDLVRPIDWGDPAP